VPLLLALPALAQEAAPSRLDAVQKSGKLRVCTPGDYTPFALQKSEGVFEGLDVDLVQTAAKALGAEPVFVKSGWPTLMKDFIEKCDVAVGGISVTLDRQKTAFFSQAYMINGKAPITRCENVAKYQTVADIDKPTVTVIENPGGSNERFARANFKTAKIVIYNDNTTIFDEILKGNADVTVRRDGVAAAARRRRLQGLGRSVAAPRQGERRVRPHRRPLAALAARRRRPHVRAAPSVARTAPARGGSSRWRRIRRPPPAPWRGCARRHGRPGRGAPPRFG